jgi:hypothetical protein
MISIPTARIARESPLIEAGESPLPELANPLIESRAVMTLAAAAAATNAARSQWLRVRFISWPGCGSHFRDAGPVSRREALRLSAASPVNS